MERKGGSTAVVTAELVTTALKKTTTVTPREEQALRMRYGATVDKTEELPTAHGGNQELADELLVIEMSLFRAMKQRAQAAKAKTEPAPRNATKSKIVGALKSKKK